MPPKLRRALQVADDLTGNALLPALHNRRRGFATAAGGTALLLDSTSGFALSMAFGTWVVLGPSIKGVMNGREPFLERGERFATFEAAKGALKRVFSLEAFDWKAAYVDFVESCQKGSLSNGLLRDFVSASVRSEEDISKAKKRNNFEKNIRLLEIIE